MAGGWGSGALGGILDSSLATLAVLSGILIALVAIGIYLIGKFRARPHDARIETNQLLSNFDEMHDQGVLSDAEYRTIKSMLVERLQTELKDSSESG
jgi:hypothetical protein